MNKQIKELAKEAGGYVSLSHEHNGKLILSGEDIVQKFAELIVRDVVEQIITRERTDGEWYQDDIFKHFGVEE